MHTVLVYGFPLLLLLFEWGLRAGLKVDASGFMGPTLAAAALSVLLPLTKPVVRKLDGFDSLSLGNHFSSSVVLTSRFDINFIAFIWVLFLLTLFGWAAACYFSLVSPNDTTLYFATHNTIGGCAYMVSVVMTSIKERQ